MFLEAREISENIGLCCLRIALNFNVTRTLFNVRLIRPDGRAQGAHSISQVRSGSTASAPGRDSDHTDNFLKREAVQVAQSCILAIITACFTLSGSGYVMRRI